MSDGGFIRALKSEVRYCEITQRDDKWQQFALVTYDDYGRVKSWEGLSNDFSCTQAAWEFLKILVSALEKPVVSIVEHDLVLN